MGAGNREARERSLEAGNRRTRGRTARAVVEQDPNLGQALERSERGSVVRLRLDRVTGQRHSGDPHHVAEDRRSERLDGGRQPRRGAGALEAWIKPSAASADLQVTVSEVRPDGNETFVQTGWLRTSERKLASSSTLLAPVPTLRKADLAPLAKGRWTEVTVPLYYEGHVYRRGSRIRITIAAPGGAQPIWAFADTRPSGRARVEVAYSRKLASRLILPVVPGVGVPTGLPPCPGLRGEPCRAYLPLVNRGA